MTADSDWAPGEPDETWTITSSEIEAQQKAQQKIEERLRLDAKLRDVSDEEERRDEIVTLSRRNREKADRLTEENKFHLPPPEYAGDAQSLTAHLYELQGDTTYVNPSRLTIPPGEDIIEVVGPLGAEGYGITRRVIARGPDTGKVIYER